MFSSCSRLRATSSLIWNAAAITPDEPRAALEDGRRDDVVEPSAREPDALGLLALVAPAIVGTLRQVGRVGERAVRPRERRALRVSSR